MAKRLSEINLQPVMVTFSEADIRNGIDGERSEPTALTETAVEYPVFDWLNFGLAFVAVFNHEGVVQQRASRQSRRSDFEAD